MKQITLTAGQLRDALNIVEEGDCETKITITEREAFVCEDSHEPQPAGFYAHLDEYPEEGVFGPLGTADSTTSVGLTESVKPN